MQAFNKVIISGDVTGRTQFGKTRDGVPACSFWIQSDRQDLGPNAFVKVNAYGDSLVTLCREELKKGLHVIVDGELMNRRLQNQDPLVEVRALTLAFYAGVPTHARQQPAASGQ